MGIDYFAAFELKSPINPAIPIIMQAKGKLSDRKQED